MEKESIKLKAESRTKEENPKNLVKKGQIPAVLYGPHLKENSLLKVDGISFDKVFEKAGESTLVDVSIDDKEEKKVLIKEIQRDPVKNNIIHIDIYEVDMNESIHTTIPLNFIGESSAVKNMGGSLIKEADEVEVKCLPGDLVNHIDVDISKLDNFGDSIHVQDINIPKGVEILNDPEGVVAIVVEPKEEKEEEQVIPAEGEEGEEGKESGEKKQEGAENGEENKKTE